MSIFNGTASVKYTRSSAGQTSEVLSAGDAVVASCDDAGSVTAADGSLLLTAAFVLAGGAGVGDRLANVNRLKSRVDVFDVGGAPVGTVTIRKYSVGPFKKKFEFALLDAAGSEVGELVTTDKKGKELAATIAGQLAASLTQVDRDRGIMQTVETWSISPGAQLTPENDLLATAAILRFGKIVSELVVPD